MKKKKQETYVKLTEVSIVYECIKIPENATHIEAEVDYSGCYYESDMPSVKLTFFKLEKE